MLNNEVLILTIILILSLCIWLYLKLKTEKKKRELLATENRQLIADNALLEAEHLKFQLQPHTLNNILAHLKVTANKLNRGMDSLSQTLEYILYKGQTHLVSIKDEINFVEQYLKLNDLFISEIDSIKLDDSQINHNSKYYNSPSVPHMITAYFIENAFKHGDVNHPDFLKIKIKLSDRTFEMIVENRVQKKNAQKKAGLGLINMKKRLDLLMTGKYEIKTNFDETKYFSTLIINF